MEQPTQLAIDANQAMTELRWNDYANMLDPQELAAFKQGLMPAIEQLVNPDSPDSLNLFGTNFNPDSLRYSTDQAFFTEIMKLVFTLSPQLGMTFGGMTNSLIGPLADGDSLVYVVFRTNMTLGMRQVEEMNVSTLSKVDGDWKLRMSPKIEGILMMVQQGLMGGGRG